MTPSLRSRLATDRRPRLLSDGPRTAAAHQRHRASPLGQLGGRLDAGQSGADDGDGASGWQLGERLAQPLRAFQFGYGIGEFGCAGHRGGHRAGAADGIDQVVVVQRGARCKLHPPAAVSIRVALSTTSRMPSPSSVP